VSRVRRLRAPSKLDRAQQLVADVGGDRVPSRLDNRASSATGARSMIARSNAPREWDGREIVHTIPTVRDAHGGLRLHEPWQVSQTSTCVWSPPLQREIAEVACCVSVAKGQRTSTSQPVAQRPHRHHRFRSRPGTPPAWPRPAQRDNSLPAQERPTCAAQRRDH